ncbi:MAG: AMP-dependent synthetase/ligase [Bacillota bacterium]
MRNYKWHSCEPINDLRELIYRSATKYGERDAFLQKTPDGVRGISYVQLKDDVEALGTGLYGLGLAGGCHIALIGENSYEWVISYLAIVNGQNVAVPIDKELTDLEIAKLLKHSDATAVICSESFYPVISSILPLVPGLRFCIGMKENQSYSTFRSIHQIMRHGKDLLMQNDRSFVDAPIDREVMSVILYTSGTTGSSKGVMLSHKNIVTVVMGAMRAVRVPRVTLSVLPVHHSYECSCGILTAMYAGVKICINDSPKYLPENLRLFKPEMLVLVPLYIETMYKRIMENVRRSGREQLLKRLIRLSNALLRVRIDVRGLFFKKIREAFGGRLKLIISGGAPLRPEMVTRFREIGIQILNGYGITECAPLVTANRNNYYDDASVGVVIPGCKVKIHEPNEDGEGEILVSGDNVMLGYYKDAEATRKVFDGEWFKTGDVGRLPEEGLLRITGRKKNTIILSNGKNVQPEEIEEYLEAGTPYIKDVVVYASCPENDAEPCISAIIVPDMEYENGCPSDFEKILREEIRKLNRGLPTFKQVQNVRIQMDDFEKTSTKKIKRFMVLGEAVGYAREN